jgi:hypothetical protein
VRLIVLRIPTRESSGMTSRCELEEKVMRAAFYTQQGGAREVLQTGELPTPEPGPGEVRVRMRASGVNPSDWKSRRGGAGRRMSAPLIIPVAVNDQLDAERKAGPAHDADDVVLGRKRLQTCQCSRAICWT